MPCNVNNINDYFCIYLLYNLIHTGVSCEYGKYLFSHWWRYFVTQHANEVVVGGGCVLCGLVQLAPLYYQQT